MRHAQAVRTSDGDICSCGECVSVRFPHHVAVGID